MQFFAVHSITVVDFLADNVNAFPVIMIMGPIKCTFLYMCQRKHSLNMLVDRVIELVFYDISISSYC